VPKGSSKAASTKPEVKAVIEAKIPQKSSAKLVEAGARLVNAGANAVEAITDIVRPLTEWAGLKGDRLRLQREEVALEIAKRASDRIKAQKAPRTPIPTKTVVRLLESGSLEEPTDDTMIDMWANLLASATHDQNAAAPRFISILEDLNGDQAKRLKDVLLGKIQFKMIVGEPLIDFATPISEKILIRSATQMTPPLCSYLLRKRLQNSNKDTSTDGPIEALKKILTKPGLAFESLSFSSGNTDNAPREIFESHFRVSKKKIDSDILAAMGLLTREKVDFFPLHDAPRETFLSFSYLRITPLCISFFNAVNPDLVNWDAVDLEPLPPTE
jgi:hypothetical protein